MSAGAVELQVRRLPEARDLPLPARGTSQAAGFDLFARLDGVLELAPGERAKVPTGIAVALPPGYEAQIRPRSGLAAREGVTLVNSPGTVDADYRGEICVILVNLGRRPVRFARGDRIAQMVVQRLTEVRLREVGELGETARGAGGFGHTGR